MEKDAIINFLSNQLVNKNFDGDSHVNKTDNDHNNSFQKRVDNIVNKNLPLVQHNDYKKKENSKSVIIIGDSVLNNINSRGLSKFKKVSVRNFPGATSEDILDEVKDTLKIHPDTQIVGAGANDLTKDINMLKSVKKLCEKAKRILPDTKIVFAGMTEMAILEAFFFASARTYQQKSSTVIFQLPKLFLFKLIFIRKNG